MNKVIKATSIALAVSLTLAGCSDDDDEIRELELTIQQQQAEISAAENATQQAQDAASQAQAAAEQAQAELAANLAELNAAQAALTANVASNGVGFTEVKAPETDAEKRQILTSPYFAVANPNDATAVSKIGFNTLMRSGEKLESNTLGDANTEIFGLIRDQNGNAVSVLQGDENTVGRDFMAADAGIISNANEHTTLLDVHGDLFAISQFESRPGTFYLLDLDQNNDTGELSVEGMKHIDLSGVRGGWVHCAASRTPWKTHLASEEYEPNAAAHDPQTGENAAGGNYYAAMSRFFSSERTTGLLEMNPYDYGWNVELEVVNGQGDVEVEKHYSMGRLAIELAYVMPDEKTAYITDDGTNVGLFMFVADTAGDLSAGTLYGMKWNQTSSKGVGAADLEWVNLGHATNSEIQAYLGGADYSGNKLEFADIFDRVDMTKTDGDGDGIEETGTCEAGYTAVNSTVGAECLKLKAGMEKAASRLETRRYAAMMGATTELRKEEGFTFDADHNKIFVAMSEVARGMEDFAKNGSPRNSYDVGGHNHIKLDAPNRCGAVYQSDINTSTEVKDTDGAVIASEYVAVNMSGLVAGRPTTAYGGTEPAYATDGPYAANKCHLDGIANPDNITYLTGMNTLIIGEDTGSGHQNDVIWSYNMDSQQLTRIQTTPYGSETTSPYWYPFIDADGDGKGFGYLMSVVQHPYVESDFDKMNSESEEMPAYTGYVGPFPAIGQ